MSTFSHTDWTVTCDHDGCIAQERTDALDLRDGAAAEVRKALKSRGWAVSIPNPDGSRQRLDYCPAHKNLHMKG